MYSSDWRAKLASLHALHSLDQSKVNHFPCLFSLYGCVCECVCICMCTVCACAYMSNTKQWQRGRVLAFAVMKLEILFFLIYWYLIVTGHCSKSSEVLQLSLACVCPATLLHTTSTGKFQWHSLEWVQWPQLCPPTHSKLLSICKKL